MVKVNIKRGLLTLPFMIMSWVLFNHFMDIYFPVTKTQATSLTQQAFDSVNKSLNASDVKQDVPVNTSLNKVFVLPKSQITVGVYEKGVFFVAQQVGKDSLTCMSLTNANPMELDVSSVEHQDSSFYKVSGKLDSTSPRLVAKTCSIQRVRDND